MSSSENSPMNSLGSTKPSSISSIMPTAMQARLRSLKQSIAQAEISLRWIDVYAAESAYLQAVSCLQMNEEQAGLVFDVALLLSHASSRGEAGMSLKGLQKYHSLSVFSRSLFGDEDALASALGELAAFYRQQEQGSQREVRVELVCHDGYWYLARHAALYRSLETWLAARVGAGLDGNANQTSSAALQMSDYVQRLFGFDSSGSGNRGISEFDYQALAAVQALVSSLVLVSGGPGTGKTTTAAKLLILRLLQAQFECSDEGPVGGLSSFDALNMERPSAICLAPTGKAAQRLASSLRGQSLSLLKSLSLAPELESALQEALPKEGMTLHRYLIQCGAPMDELSSFVRVSDNERVFGMSDQKSGKKSVPSLIVVDESSMIDLALMERLIATLDERTSLVLMGDPYQLPPVEVGQVFSDWVGRFESLVTGDRQLNELSSYLPYSKDEIELAKAFPSNPNDLRRGKEEAMELLNPLVRLHKSYRFTGALAELALIVRDDAFPALAAFADGQSEQANEPVLVHWLDEIEQSALLAEIESAYQAYADVAANKASLAELQQAFDQYQVLCSTRLGALGTQEVNERIDKMLRQHCQTKREELLDKDLFHGQAILIEANYPALDIYNGDIGFVLEDANGRTSFQFYRGEHIEPIVVPGHKLTGYSLAYALTVHKSQGSEYHTVSVVVAPYAAELVSRRLLYTGITRSMEGLSLYISREQSQALLGQVR